MTRKGPCFTEAARLAAAEKRRERAGLAAQNFNVPAVFVIRAEAGGFKWEIRKFGGVPLQQSASCYDSTSAARQAGTAALERFRTPNGSSIETADFDRA